MHQRIDRFISAQAKEGDYAKNLVSTVVDLRAWLQNMLQAHFFFFHTTGC
jgi:hypothetical protein